ncbi:MAG: ComF family protein [Crocinitomicaceae bacterium]|nr:ComF family protein [Crocinitomicaceae bacterium]
MAVSLKFIIQSAIQAIYPENCCICGKDLIRGESFICYSCSYDLPYIKNSQSDRQRLNALFTGRVEIEQVYALLNYQKGNQVQTILHTIKYKMRPRLAEHLGSQLAQQIKAESSFDGIVPLPLHPKKERARGFNQSQAIADGMSEILNLPVWNNCVIRKTANVSQTKFSKFDRYENVRSIFSVVNSDQLQNKRVLLIDDVLTTGATLESCAGELLNAAKCKVSIATLAARI